MDEDAASGNEMFQSTPPRGGRRCINIRQFQPRCFNPRPRAGGDVFSKGVTSYIIPFQSTPPRGGRRCRPPDVILRIRFNPRPRAGGDIATLLDVYAGDNVSIHAPARGATFSLHPSRKFIISFNPRPRAGGDKLTSGGEHDHPGFNPRPRAGGDPAAGTYTAMFTSFQSTPPRGGRLDEWVRKKVLRCFNPRPRAGGDQQHHMQNLWQLDVSIHAPARGATDFRQECTPSKKFQSTPPRGGRRG